MPFVLNKHTYLIKYMPSIFRKKQKEVEIFFSYINKFCKR
jgi:hypothetical protein